jgi:bis(5'-adenosyl)-triphosphatase
MNTPGLLLPGCPFCDPAILGATFIETDHFRAVYNISPILPGHSLVIPKWHVESYMSLTAPELTEMMLLIQRGCRVLEQVFLAEGFNLALQEALVAGQSVPHLHFHIIPRQTGDLPEPGAWYPKLVKEFYQGVIDSEHRPRYSPEELEQIAGHLRTAAASIP